MRQRRLRLSAKRLNHQPACGLVISVDFEATVIPTQSASFEGALFGCPLTLPSPPSTGERGQDGRNRKSFSPLYSGGRRWPKAG